MGSVIMACVVIVVVDFYRRVVMGSVIMACVVRRGRGLLPPRGRGHHGPRDRALHGRRGREASTAAVVVCSVVVPRMGVVVMAFFRRVIMGVVVVAVVVSHLHPQSSAILYIKRAATKPCVCTDLVKSGAPRPGFNIRDSNAPPGKVTPAPASDVPCSHHPPSPARGKVGHNGFRYAAVLYREGSDAPGGKYSATGISTTLGPSRVRASRTVSATSSGRST